MRFAGNFWNFWGVVLVRFSGNLLHFLEYFEYGIVKGGGWSRSLMLDFRIFLEVLKECCMKIRLHWRESGRGTLGGEDFRVLIWILEL